VILGGATLGAKRPVERGLGGGGPVRVRGKITWRASSLLSNRCTMPRKQDKSRCRDLLIIDRMPNSPMPPSFRATVGCFAFITLIFARVASSQVATTS